MTSLRLRYQTVEVGDVDIHLRTLRDMQQFQDEDGVAAALGISSAVWPLFGVMWDSGRALAHLMIDYDVAGRRILEVGCGIGLASLVLNQRTANITATDYHPETERFLMANVALNGGPPIPFVRAAWLDADCGLGEFDLIIGSDLLYERAHVLSLSGFIDRHARPACEVLIVDPGRGEQGRFSKRMEDLGYTPSRRRVEPSHDLETYHGQVLRYLRTEGTAPTPPPRPAEAA